MNEDRTPDEGSHEPILNPEPEEEFHEPSSSGLKIAVVVFVLVAILAIGYGWMQHDTAQQLASDRTALRTSLTDAKNQEDNLMAKVNALSAVQAQEEAARAQEEAARQAEAAKREQALAQAREASRHARPAARRAPVEDPRWKQFQSQLGDQQKALAESQQQIAETQANLLKARTEMQDNLQSARTELGGDIARNHTQLVALEKKGERNYFEFSFEKSKTYHHTGPISIALHKADTKHEYCDLQMLVDDREISRKHVNLYESVALYPEGYVQPLELVINHIGKDSIQGYVSEPKYGTKERAAELTSPAPAPATASASANPPVAAPPAVNLVRRADAAH